MADISPHAIVQCPANLADDVVVGAFSHVGADVHIGPGTRIANNVTLAGKVRMGRNNHVYPFAVIGQPDPPDRVGGEVVLGDGNRIREHAVICSGRDGDGQTRIGNDSLIMVGCYIGPDVQIDDSVVLGNYSQLGRGTRAETHVWSAAFTGTRAGVTIGRYTFTSGYAGVDRDAPPYAMLHGSPFRVRGVNTHNLKRCGFREEAIASLKEAFRALFNGEDRGVCAAALAELAGRDDLDEHVRYLVAFLGRGDSGRGTGGDDQEGGGDYD